MRKQPPARPNKRSEESSLNAPGDNARPFELAS
jgi:hypothetical protein